MAHILICDDAPDLRLVMRLTLEAAGHTTLEAEGGGEALELLGLSAVDLMILDVQMPGMDGWAVLKAVRRTPAIATLPIIMCTVKLSRDDLVRAWTEGCDGYIGKPFDLRELTAMVNDSLASEAGQRLDRRQDRLALLKHFATHTNA